MNIPDNLIYSKEHEWLLIEGNVATIGISDFAQDQLGDIVMVELPEIGQAIGKDEAFGVVESVKSVSDVFAPVAGKIVEVNTVLEDSPNLVNEDCYGEGWIVKMEVSDISHLKELLDASSYEKFLKEEE